MRNKQKRDKRLSELKLEINLNSFTDKKFNNQDTCYTNIQCIPRMDAPMTRDLFCFRAIAVLVSARLDCNPHTREKEAISHPRYTIGTLIHSTLVYL